VETVVDALSQEIARIAQARFDAIEKACEAALASGVCGVLIDGDKVGLSDRVPYGHIYDITNVQDEFDVVGWRTT
jgi:hypothetical protein